jgi:hypothetical protein
MLSSNDVAMREIKSLTQFHLSVGKQSVKYNDSDRNEAQSVVGSHFSLKVKKVKLSL